MGAIPVLHSLNDIRNLFTVIWYSSLAVILFACIKNLRVAIIFSGTGGVDRCQVLLVGLCVMVLPFIPATNLFFFNVGFVVAERIVYIPSIGFCFVN